MSETPHRLRAALRSRRLAVVLAGGGALGAYEVGVLRVLESLRVEPAILAGVSVGAINAVAWLTHGFRTRGLERVWSTLRGSQVGLRWTSLVLRGVGGLVAAVGGVEMLLTLVSSQELSAVRLLHRRISVQSDVQAVLLDATSWLVIAVLGVALLFFAQPADQWLARLSVRIEGARANRWLGRALLLAVLVHVLTLSFGVPWPHRFSASAIVLGAVVWFINRPGDSSDRARKIILRLLPETHGRGMWNTEPRRRLLVQLVGEGDPKRLTDHSTHLIISACDLASGRICHFTNWGEPGDRFRGRIADAMGDVMPLSRAPDLIRAALASSAIPLIYEPVRLHGRDYVDAGAFSNQPVHVAIADDAEAVLVVLLAPSAGPEPLAHDPHLLELAGRLLELASWREMQSELRHMPSEWTTTPNAAGEPARVCVVEPDHTLPGGVLGFDPAQASLLMQRGEADAWTALERAGWIEAG